MQYFGPYFISENILCNLLSLVAVFLLNKICVSLVLVQMPEFCQKCEFFPEKEDERHFIYVMIKCKMSAL